MSLLLVSYIPLLDEAKGQVSQEVAEDLKERIVRGMANSFAIGTLWCHNTDDDSLYPVLIYNNGDEIVDHMNRWSEGKPEDWFTFTYVDRGDEVTLAIAPKYQRSIDRHKESDPDCDLSNIKVLMCLLSSITKKSEFSDRFLASVPSRVPVGILDSTSLMFGKVEDLDLSKHVTLFHLDVNDGDFNDYWESVN